MTLTLNIPKEIEAGLLAEAHARGLSPEAYAAEVLAERVRPVVTRDPARPAGRKSLSQLFAESPLKGLSLECERDRDTGRSVDL